jgi:hypothetical protein
MFPVERARALLRRVIPTSQSVPARKVHVAARQARIPEWALRKARRTMDIEVCFVGFGANGRWVWSRSAPWRWTPPDPEPAPPAPTCGWPGCAAPPRSRRAVYCTAHKQLALRRSKRAWAQRDRASLRRARERLGRR